MAEPPSFNPRQYLNLYLTGEYDLLSTQFIDLLSHFEKVRYLEATPDFQYFIDVFIKNFLYLFSQPDYIIGDRHALRFIQLNPVIANLTAISHQRTTDYHLEMLQKQPQNFIKILTLYNARCQTKIDYDQLFQTNAVLATRWYSYYIELYLSAQVDPIARENLRHHITYAEKESLVEFGNIADVYFGATYINPDGDRPIKRRLNAAIQSNGFCRDANIKNTEPNFRHIAVVTAHWQPNHSVYRTLSQYLEAVSPDYELTLIALDNLENVDTHLFSQMISLEVVNGALNIEPIRENNFGIVYFPDVGMSPESILLSNLRLAPIQIAGTGHPVSTYGSQIDYMFSGADVELPALAAQNYDERLILLSGNGAIHDQPTYKLKNSQKQSSEIIVNCPWLAQKINSSLIALLASIQKQSRKAVIYRFFVANSLRKNGLIPFVNDLEKYLESGTFQVVTQRPYENYMALMEEGDLSLDSYPFGGSNVMADSLYLRKPTVTLQGEKWANRIAAQMLRQVGLGELIATNGDDYIQKAVKLIDNTAYRQGVGDRLKNVDLSQTIFSTEHRSAFKKAVDYLVAHHQGLAMEDTKSPVFIQG